MLRTLYKFKIMTKEEKYLELSELIDNISFVFTKGDLPNTFKGSNSFDFKTTKNKIKNAYMFKTTDEAAELISMFLNDQHKEKIKTQIKNKLNNSGIEPFDFYLEFFKV